MAKRKQLVTLLLGLLFSTIALAQNPSPLPETEVAAIFSIRQQWQGHPVVSTWNGEDPCNLWNGVVCFYDPYRNITNIVQLSFANANVPGPVPPEIGNFSRLNALVLTNNQFSGPIPTTLSNLFYLKRLLLNNNQLTGGIPAEFGLLPGLQILNVDNNQLDQPLPHEIFQITELQQLSVQSNQIPGNIPVALLGAIHLLSLNLRSNQLNGTIPSLLGNLTTLQSIDLSSNSLSGTIPASLGSLQALTYLSLSDNKLSGPIPTALANIPNLQSLWLFNNELTGSIPRELQFVPDFRAYGNELSGPSPAAAPIPGAQICIPGTSVSCTCPTVGLSSTANGMLYCNSNGSAYSPCICQPQQCRTCPLGQTARPVSASDSCPNECLTPLVVLVRIVNLTMADFDNSTATLFRSTLAKQLELSLDQVGLLQIAPGSVIATVAFLPPSGSNATALDPQASLRIATALLSQSLDLGTPFSPYQTLTVLPTGQSTPPTPTATPAAPAPIVVKVKDTSWPWVVSLLVLSIAVLVAVLGVVAWCCLTGRCFQQVRHGPSPPHSRRFQPLLTNDPDTSLMANKDARALMVRPSTMPYVSMPPSTPHSRNPLLSQGPQSGPVSGVERLQEERELNTWSPAGANEPQRQLMGRTALEGDRRRPSEEVTFEPPARKVPVLFSSSVRPQVPGRSPQDQVVPTSIGLTQLGGPVPAPPTLMQPAIRPAMGHPPESAVLSSVGAREVPLAVLQTATDNFSEANWVGTGGFGLVYRGVLPVMHCPEKVRGKKPSQDIEVAVKVLDVDTSLSDGRFKTQMELLGRLKHKYLVELVGYCMEGNVRMLVYEFMAFGSLADHLHGPRSGQPQFHHLVELTWRQRMRIAYGAARGLNYLHTPEASSGGASPLVGLLPGRRKKPVVVHRDLSTSNILLDDNMQVRVGDFGLAPLMLTSPSEAGDSSARGKEKEDTDEPPTPTDGPAQKGVLASPGVRSAASQGTASPRSPSTAWTSPKSDVFAFGIVLLELVTGSPPLDESRSESQQHIIAWAKPHLTNRETMTEIVDPKLGNRAPLVELYQVAAVISMCIQPDEASRPPMSVVVQMLAPLSEAPDPDQPSEGRPESGWSGSSGTGTERGAESSGRDSSYKGRGFGRGSDSSPSKGGAFFQPPRGEGRGREGPAGYEEHVSGANAEGLHPVHMSPEIKPERPLKLYSVRMPEYRIPEEVLRDLERQQIGRKEKEPWSKGTARPASSCSEQSSSSGSDRTGLVTPDSVLPGPWGRKQGKRRSSSGRKSQTLVAPPENRAQDDTHLSLALGPNTDLNEKLIEVEAEEEEHFVDEPRENRKVGTPSKSKPAGSRSSGDESPGKSSGKKRSLEGGSPRRERVRSKSEGS